MDQNLLVIYRIPELADAENIVEFYNRVGGETNYLSFERDEYPLDTEAQEKRIIELLLQKNSTMLLAFLEEAIVGIGTITSSQKIKSKHLGELGIVVTKEQQGKGIGSEIIKRLLCFASSNGITTKINLSTRTDNTLAVSLYLKFGFVVEGCLKNETLLEGNYYDIYMMGKMIGKSQRSS